MQSEEEYKKLMDGCYSPKQCVALGEYANLPEYLRRMCIWYVRNTNIKKEHPMKNCCIIHDVEIKHGRLPYCPECEKTLKKQKEGKSVEI